MSAYHSNHLDNLQEVTEAFIIDGMRILFGRFPTRALQIADDDAC